MKLLRNIDCFCPFPAGKKDILIAGCRIEKMAEPGSLSGLYDAAQIYDCDGMLAFPGIIDQHVHLLGGGGEEGPESRTGELAPGDIIKAGATTVIGLLGVDCYTRSMGELYIKGKALEAQGISTYLYTGSSSVPAHTLTGSIVSDLIYIDKVIGVGEVAIADHLSTLVSLESFIQLASDAHIGGLLGGKAGVVHIHVGDGKDGLDSLLRLLDASDLPVECFIPTHVNRNESLFRQAAKYCKAGGFIDLTAGETNGISVPDAIAMLISIKADLKHVTVSSDGNGSIPGGGTASVRALYEDIKSCMLTGLLPPDQAMRLVTENVARALKLHPTKGALQEGSDADILVTDRQFSPSKLFCKGNPVLEMPSGFVS